MGELSRSELVKRRADFDQAVYSTADIDHFCSSSMWTLPAVDAFSPECEVRCFELSDGFAAFAEGRGVQGLTFLQPLEATWMLACPLVGKASGHVVQEFFAVCAERSHPWQVLLIGGVPENSLLYNEVLRCFGGHYAVFLGPACVRHVIDLTQGVEAFLGSRTRNFRKALTRSQKRARTLGVEFVSSVGTADAESLFKRLLAVEQRSWKGRSGVGICDGPMHEFYRDMMPRLVSEGALRLIFAVQGGKDIGYILGGVRNDTYRGLQFSFDSEFATLGLGNLLQLEQIKMCIQEGLQIYDLGTDNPYKRRWAKEGLVTRTLILRRP